MGRPGRDEQAAHDRQDLREGIFARAKTDLDRTRWSRDWPWSRKRCRPRGHRTSSGKSSGKRSAGNPPAPFDEAGTGDVTMGAGLRPKAKGLDKPPDPTVRAPVLDPTGGGLMEKGRNRFSVTAEANGLTNPGARRSLASRLPYTVYRTTDPHGGSSRDEMANPASGRKR